jgi:hypothetical protein
MFLSIHVYSQSGEAVTYMNDLSEITGETKKETWQYLKAVTRGKGARKVENKRQKLIQEMKAVKLKVKRKGAFKGDLSLKTSTIEYLDLSYNVIKGNYDKILDMEAIAQDSYDLMEAYITAQEQASETMREAFEISAEAQKTFAEKHNITLIEGEGDKTSKKIAKASKTLKYYNEIYLIFFKPFKEEVYVLEAQQRDDIKGMEDYIARLDTASAEGLAKIKAHPNYGNDMALKNAARDMLLFYSKEAKKDFPQILDFYKKKQHFETVKKSFDAKKPKQRTKKDVDQFNKAVKDYNNAIKTFNNVLKSGNTQRGAKFKQWNQRTQSFFDKHSK